MDIGGNVKWFILIPIYLNTQESKLSVICERVFDRCLAPTAGGEGCDNMTMILVQFKKPFNNPNAASTSAEELPSSSNQTLSGLNEGSSKT